MVSTGTLQAASMRTVKDAVLEVQRGEECGLGLGLDGFDDFEEGDVVECYSVEQKKRVFVESTRVWIGWREVMVVTSIHRTDVRWITI